VPRGASPLRHGKTRVYDQEEDTEEQDLESILRPKTYPAYFGAYDCFDEIRAFVDRFANLFLIGRNGMHKYNHQDHSILTAMVLEKTLAKA
jgi:hypothetical protein